MAWSVCVVPSSWVWVPSSAFWPHEANRNNDAIKAIAVFFIIVVYWFVWNELKRCRDGNGLLIEPVTMVYELDFTRQEERAKERRNPWRMNDIFPDRSTGHQAVLASH